MGIRVLDLEYKPATNCARLSHDGNFASEDDVRKFLEVLPVLSQSLSEVCKGYNYRVNWAENDDCHVARVEEHPLLAADGDTPEEALKELFVVVEDTVKDMEACGEQVPQPAR